MFQARLTNDVYHYTGVDTAIYGILDRGAIRLGPYESTNDPQESRPKFPPLSSHHDHEPADNEVHQIWTHADWWLRRYVKVACFTQDFELPENALDENALRGWAHASEWAHYGADHGGACLRFDRTKLVEQFHAQMGSRGQCFDGAVAYPVQRFSGLPVDLLDLGQVREFGIDAVVSRYIEKHYEDLFFTKHHDWIRRYLAKEMYTTAFNVDESDAMFSRTDPEVEKAVDTMPKASALLESARKIIVQRMNGQR